MPKIRKNIAQSAVEYSLVIAVVVSALVTINVYVKRGLQGRIADASDDFATTVRDNWPAVANENSATFQMQFEDDKVYKSISTNIKSDKENYTMDAKNNIIKYITNTEVGQVEWDFYQYKSP